MATSLLDRLGFGNDRAVANARQAALQRRREDRIVADLVEGIRRHDAIAASRARGGAAHPRTAAVDAA